MDAERAPGHVYLRATFFCVLGLAAARQRGRSMEAGGDPQGHTGHTPKDNRGHMLHPHYFLSLSFSFLLCPTQIYRDFLLLFEL